MAKTRYHIDVELTGYETVTVDADNLEQAYDLADDRFWEIYDGCSARSLRCKSTELTLLSTERTKQGSENEEDD